MSTLIADQLSFGWLPDDPLFENISFAIDRERVGLVGANGSGKSTLIRLLTGELMPSAGHVSSTGKLLYVSQRPDMSLTIAEALGIARKLAALDRFSHGEGNEQDYTLIGEDWDIEDRARSALKMMGLPDRPWTDAVSSLSGGQLMRLRLARIGLERPDVLILDEPTNDLDASGLDLLRDLVKNWQASLLVVSHDRSLLSEVDRILELSSLGLRSYGGDYAAYKAAKEVELEAAHRRLNDAQKQVKSARRDSQTRKERDARRQAHGKRTKTGSQPKMVLNAMKQRAEGTVSRTQDLHQRKTEQASSALDKARREVEIMDPLSFEIPSSALPAQKRVLDIDAITVRFDQAGRPILEDFSLQITGPQRIAVLGGNGAGKSTLLKAIFSQVPISTGRISLGVEKAAFLRQDAINHDPQQSLVDYYLERNPEQTQNEARAALARFGFRNVAAESPVGALSGGERLRANLATLLMSAAPPQLLVLDEPTNHMDLNSTETLERALSAYDGALMVASHDLWFLDAIGIDTTIEL